MKTIPIRINRSTDADLSFVGSLVAESTSRRSDDALRWTDLRVYHEESGKWVFETVGRTRVPDESNIVRAYVAETPAELVQKMHKDDDNGGFYLSFPAKLLLRQLKELFPTVVEFDLCEKI